MNRRGCVRLAPACVCVKLYFVSAHRAVYILFDYIIVAVGIPICESNRCTPSATDSEISGLIFITSDVFRRIKLLPGKKRIEKNEMKHRRTVTLLDVGVFFSSSKI